MKTENEIINDIVNGALEDVERALRASIARCSALCESPIERVFIAAVMARSRAFPALYGVHFLAVDKPSEASLSREWAFPGLFIIPQFKVGPYRADFVIINVGHDCRPQLITAIELDGHDFHERTRAQAARDKSRDRYLTAKGWRIVRFAGSEVWAAPGECAREALNIALDLREGDFG